MKGKEYMFSISEKSRHSSKHKYTKIETKIK